jgi:hypothetical protein
MRTRLLVSLIPVVGFFAVAPFAVAGSIDPTTLGKQAFVDFGTPTTNTGNINTATSFMIGNLVSTTNNTGVFAGIASQFFGPLSFNINSPTSFIFGNSLFGTFRSSSITVAVNTPGFLNLDISGAWTPGTFSGLVGQGPFVSQFGLTFVQVPAGVGVISNSATLSVSSTVIPEPSTYLMGLTGIASAGVLYRLRRRRPLSIATT